MSACMSGTRSSGALSSKGDVLVRGVVECGLRDVPIIRSV